MTAEDIRARLDAAPMSRAQQIAVAITFLLSALDGYDVLSVTFAAPAISAQWGIGKGALGAVLSAGLTGMALGSFLLAPLADVIGRKAMVQVSLALMGFGMLGSAFAGDTGMLIAWRVVTGLGIGTCVAVINPVSAEFANARRRALTVSIMAIGYPVGGVLGGLLSAYLLAAFDWPAVFLTGVAAATVMMPLVAWLLPESPAFLMSGRGRDSLDRLNSVLARCNQPLLDALPRNEAPAKRGYAAVFARGQLGATLWLTTANFLFVFTVYFILSWIPQMVADAGFAPAQASLVSASASLFGVAGGIALGTLAQLGGLRWLTSGAMIGLGLSTILFGLTPPSLALLIVAGGICGFFLFGGASGLYATLATTFRDEARASGVGFVIGMGRISSAIAPLVAGSLFASGFTRGEVSVAFGVLAGLAGIIVIAGWRKFRAA